MRNISVGDHVTIKKPLHHQGMKGTVIRIDVDTGYGTLYFIEYENPRSSVTHGFFQREELISRGPEKPTEGENDNEGT